MACSCLGDAAGQNDADVEFQECIIGPDALEAEDGQIQSCIFG